MSNYYISIITANLNNARGLQNTIESIKDINYSTFEHIIIDGGSTDSSLDVIKNHSQNISYYISEPDNGIYDALNKGLKIAKGDWISFMNSGDMFCSKNILPEIFCKEIEDDLFILYGNTLVTETDKRIIPPSKINKCYFYFNTICHQSVFFRRKLFDQIGLYSLAYKVLSDKEFFLRAYMHNYKFSYINLDICRWEAEGFSSRNRKIANSEVKILNKKYYTVLEQFILFFIKQFKRLKRFITNYKIKFLM